MFQIEYRGKRYDCVGHLRNSAQSETSGHSRVKFTGYYGYNGPINIQKLRDAAIDYYNTITAEPDNSLSLVQSNTEKQSGIDVQAIEDLSTLDKSYVFNVGSYERQALRKAS